MEAFWLLGVLLLSQKGFIGPANVHSTIVNLGPEVMVFTLVNPTEKAGTTVTALRSQALSSG